MAYPTPRHMDASDVNNVSDMPDGALPDSVTVQLTQVQDIKKWYRLSQIREGPALDRGAGTADYTNV